MQGKMGSIISHKIDSGTYPAKINPPPEYDTGTVVKSNPLYPLCLLLVLLIINYTPI